jgi:hypothetical protein
MASSARDGRETPSRVTPGPGAVTSAPSSRGQHHRAERHGRHGRQRGRAVEARGSVREQNVEARGSAREQNTATVSAASVIVSPSQPSVATTP